MTQESRLVITVDSRKAKTELDSVDKSLKSVEMQGSIGHDFSVCILYHIEVSHVDTINVVLLNEVHLVAVQLPCSAPIVGRA